MESPLQGSTIQASLDWLYQQFPSYQLIGSKAFKPTLEHTEKILAHLQHPEKELKFIHVAGSNVKGSVSCYLASILKEHGLRVGLFTSPHIVHFSERIRVNGEPISDTQINAFVSNIRNARLNFEPSFFEITFGMALQHFKEMQCDICVIETGLGGRLDATNVITPELCIITSIALEHTDLLGNTLDAIAGEKAGIIKAQVPVVLGRGCQSTANIFDTKAKALAAPLYFAEPCPEHYSEYFNAGYQKENFACVLHALELLPYSISPQKVHAGIKNIAQNSGYFGRLQKIQTAPDIIFDVAHNPDGIQATLEAVLGNLEGELHLIYGSSKDKDIRGIISLLPNSIHLYATTFRNSRSLSVTDLKHYFDASNFKSVHYFDRAPQALETAKQRAKKKDTILALGSFFLLSDFF
jgi:dihydrofolate synthase/folylpolyglutamate synthase